MFGELYFLLEYRDEQIRLQYSDEPFSLPENLLLLATMNTADRSIALVDLALRRRFHFHEFFPDQAPIQGLLKRWLDANVPEMSEVADLVDLANQLLGDRDAAIGHSHFMREDLGEEWLDLIWTHSVLPYLAERFVGDEAAGARAPPRPPARTTRAARGDRAGGHRRPPDSMKLQLTEHTRLAGVPLTGEQVTALLSAGAQLSLSPSPGRGGHYDITPGSCVGALKLGELDIEVRPKVPVENLMFMLSYASEHQRLLPLPAAVAAAPTVHEAAAAWFATLVARAFRRGVLQGYHSDEADLIGLRGRALFDEQLRRRPLQMLPHACRYDDFSEDTEQNRVLRAAAAAPAADVAALAGAAAAPRRTRGRARARARRALRTPAPANLPLRPAQRTLPTRA